MEVRRKTRIDRLTADREEIPEIQDHTLTKEGLLMEAKQAALPRNASTPTLNPAPDPTGSFVP